MILKLQTGGVAPVTPTAYGTYGSRAEYEKKYKEYLDQKRMQDSTKVKDAVTTGTGAFTQNYIVPAVKTAVDLTPIGFVNDAMEIKQGIENKSFGSTALSVAGAALPFVGGTMLKKVASRIPTQFNAATNIANKVATNSKTVLGTGATVTNTYGNTQDV